MSTITALIATLSADTSGFTDQMNRSAQMLKQWDKNAASVFAATRTPLEQYEHAVKHLNAFLMTGRINQETYARAVKAAAQDYRDATSGASGLSQVLGRGFPGLSALATPIGATVAVTTAATAALTGLAAGAVAAGVEGVKLAADYEQTEVAFTTMLGSANVAKAVLADLSQFAAATPFEFPELKGASQKLLAFGVEAQQLIPTLRTIGDVSAGISQPIGEIAEIYGKARTQGRLFGDDIRQLGGRGIPIVAELAKQFGVAESAVPKLVEAGKVGFDNLQRAFVSLTSEGGRFHNMMDAQSQTLIGLSSTLKDNVNLALRDFGIELARNFNLAGNLTSLIELTSTLRSDAAPSLALVTHQVAELGIELAKLDPRLGILGSLFQSDAGFAETLHAGLLRVDLTIASLKGDTERELRDLSELAKLAQRVAAGPAQAKTPAELEIESRGPDMSSAEKQAKDFSKFLDGLKDKINGLGKTSAQAKLDEFAPDLDADQLREATEAVRYLDRAQDLDKLRQFTEGLHREIDAFGEVGKAAELLKFEQMGLTEADLEQARALDAKLAGLKAEKKALEESAKAQHKLEEARAKVIEETRSPLEKFQTELLELSELLAQGMISPEAFDKAASHKLGDLAGKEHSAPAAVERGSAEAYSAILKATARDKLETTAGRQLIEAERARALLESIDRAMSRTGQTILEVRDIV